jgi:MATE family multidrug resistance protein
MRLQAIREEMPALLRLAFPLILGELGWVAMALVDTVMVGRMRDPSVNMAAAALAGVLFNTCAFGIGGVLLSLDTVIAQAFGADDVPAANRWLVHGVLLAVGLAALLLALFMATPLVLAHFPVDHEILSRAVPALRGLSWGVLPLLVYFALRRYLQAAHQARPIAFALISANLINAGFDWLLIYGHRFDIAGHRFAVAAYGVTGSSWSTSLARVYLMLVLVIAVYRADRRHGFGLRHVTLKIELAHLRRLFQLGAPAGGQILVEIAIFALVTSIIATFGALQLAGHEIALQCASTSFMVPFAISAATAVRVGHALGRLHTGQGTADEAAAAGWSGIAAGAGFMLLAALLFVTMPARIAHLFTPDPTVIAAAVPLLLIAAGFQFFDGVQITATGAMRGAGRTTTPLYTHFVCYWVVGMPLGWGLAFHQHMAARGLWLGLLISLAGGAMVLVTAWQRLTRTFAAAG